MGACCSCCPRLRQASQSSSRPKTELSNRSNKKSTGGPSLSIARVMSSPSINVENETNVSGYGLALVGVTIEQDAAYWEAHVVNESAGSQEVWFGVATKRDQKFYKEVEEQEDDSTEARGTLMRKIKVSNNDVVGVAVQQSDLPMIQFLLNGEPLHGDAINRFRGAVYPAVYLPEGNDGLIIKLVFQEKDFQRMSPHPRFGPVIIARGII